MDENLSRGYIQLGKGRVTNDLRFTNGSSHLSPPVDKYNFIYFSLILAGIGFLLPYNSFIIAVDFFQARYPESTIIYDMSLIYILMAFFAVLANNVLVETLCLNTRITFGYIVSFVTLLFVATLEVWWDVFDKSTSYTINLIAVAVVSLGCTVQQSSFYGYTSMLPSRYTQAVMAGESAAGFIVSGNRILTKLMFDDQRQNTSVFFVVSVLILGICFVMHQITQRSDFVKFYVTLCRESQKIVLEPTEDVGLMDTLEQNDSVTKSQYGVLKLQQSPLATDSGTSSSENNVTGQGSQFSGFSFSNPVYEPTANSTPGTTYKVEDVVIRMTNVRASKGERIWSGLRRGLTARWEVSKIVWPYMVAIGAAYFVTLCLYPGIESEIISCKFDSWMPVILLTMFNGADLVGKVVASVRYDWSRTELIVFAWLRAILIPLLLFCATPRGKPLIRGEGYPMLFSVVLGVTNGIIGSVPMIIAPSRVPEEHRELTGNIMTLSYNIGLTTGSFVAYILRSLLGPPLSKSTCKFDDAALDMKPIRISPFNSTMNTTIHDIMNVNGQSQYGSTLLSINPTNVAFMTTVAVTVQNITTVVPTGSLLGNFTNDTSSFVI